MPYKIKGNTVVKKDTGKVVGHSKNPEKYLRVLNAVEHGWVPNHGNFHNKRMKKHGADK